MRAEIMCLQPVCYLSVFVLVALLLACLGNTRSCPSFPVRCYFLDKSKNIVINKNWKQTPVRRQISSVAVLCASPLSTKEICNACNKHFSKKLEMTVFSVTYINTLYGLASRPSLDVDKGYWITDRCVSE